MEDQTPVARAFSRQAGHFDEDDRKNPILFAWRKQVYAHVDSVIKPAIRILELNAGTGIDAIRFAAYEHRIHATDVSSGMIDILKGKIAKHRVSGISVQQVSYENLSEVPGEFDLVFSNFGGLNCAADLTPVVRELPAKLKGGGLVTWVIMPAVCPWEWTWIIKGKFKTAFRRFRRRGSIANLEGEHFQTYYYSLRSLKKILGPSFVLVRTESLGLVKPPPSATNFFQKHPRVSSWLEGIDNVLKDIYPFNRWGDHIIVTFFYSGS